MMGFIIDLFLEIGERLGGSAIKSLRKIPLRVRVFILTALFVCTVFLFYPELIRATAALCRQWAMASFNRAAIPLRGEDRQKLDNLISNLGELIYSGYYSKRIERQNEEAGRASPWVTAQVAVALSGLNLPNRRPIDADKINTSFDKARSSDCGAEGLYCWKEALSDDERRANVGVSAWVIYAKARLGAAAKPEEIRFLLSMQNKVDDSWPMLPCKEPNSGSTYATAWAIMALGEQARRGLVEEAMLSEVNDAVRAGLFWLGSQRRPENGLWWSYPGKGWPGEISFSNSGLIVHIIHDFEHNPVIAIKQAWMANLNGKRTPATGVETFNSWVCEKENIQRDYTRYMILPWKLVATVDSYSEGSIEERAQAIKLVESTASEDEAILREEIKQQYFVAAELLISLRHLRESFLSTGRFATPNPRPQPDDAADAVPRG